MLLAVALPEAVPQELALPLAVALLEAVPQQVVAWSAAAPAGLRLVAAGQVLIPAKLLLPAMSRLLLCVRVRCWLWSECAADRYP